MSLYNVSVKHCRCWICLCGSSNLSLNLNAQFTEGNSQQVRHGSEPNELLRVLKHKNVHLDGDGTVSRGSAAQWEWSEYWSAESSSVTHMLLSDQLPWDWSFGWTSWRRRWETGFFFSVFSAWMMYLWILEGGWIESDSYYSLSLAVSLWVPWKPLWLMKILMTLWSGRISANWLGCEQDLLAGYMRLSHCACSLCAKSVTLLESVTLL